MFEDNEAQSIAWAMTDFLRGRVQFDRVPYVCAEAAFVMARLGETTFCTEEEFVDSINYLKCDLDLKVDLMKDLRPHWENMKRLQNRLSVEQWRGLIRHFAFMSDRVHLSTPSCLVPLIERLLSPCPDEEDLEAVGSPSESKMLDLACGNGVVMSEVLRQDPTARAEGVDIEPRCVNFARMVTDETSDRVALVAQDAFPFVSARISHEIERGEKPRGECGFDKIFCNPPIGLQHDRNWLNDQFRQMAGGFEKISACAQQIRGGCPSELRFMLAVIAALKDKGRAVMLMPEGSLSSQMSDSRVIRKFLVEGFYPECVISLPSRISERTMADLCLIVLSADPKRKAVTMIDASGLGVRGPRATTLADETVNRIVEAADCRFDIDREWNGKYRKMIPLETIADEEHNYDLSPRRYFAEAKLPVFANAIRLEEMVASRIERGINARGENLDEIPYNPAKSGYEGEVACYYLTPGDISTGLVAAHPNGLSRIPERSSPLTDSEILIMRTGAVTKLAIFDAKQFDKPVYINSNLYAFRVNAKKIDPWYLRAFLESAEGIQMLSLISVGSVIKSISLQNLKAMKIPMLPLVEQHAIGAAYKSRFDRIVELERELDALRGELPLVYANR